MKKNETMFKLKAGDKFILNGKEFVFVKTKYKVLNRIGKSLIAICIENGGREQWFTRNHIVTKKE